MRTVLIGITIALIISPAMAQQDPNDPGLPDSIIVGSAEVDSSGTYTYINIPIDAVTDDSVIFYDVSLHWDAPRGGVGIGTGTLYFYPLTQWDEHYDTILNSDSCVESIGWAETIPDSIPNPPLITDYVRWNIIIYRFIIAPNTPRQVVTLDSCQTNWFGIDSVAFVPRFQPGYIIIGPEVGVNDEKPIPGTFSLSQNYPNPFNGQTLISFSLPSDQRVRLAVFDILGREVKSLVDEMVSAGSYSVTWDGKNDKGEAIPSGIYFYRLSSAKYDETKRMVLIR